MSGQFKEPKEFYDIACKQFDEDFYEWIMPPDVDKLQVGQICNAPVWYEKSKRWYLEGDHYDPIKEEESTWKAKVYTGKDRNEKKPQAFVAKYFELEKSENLFASTGKYRPVILVKKYINDWINPANTTHHFPTWMCLPIFSYQEKHNQDFILNDMAFKTPSRIYIPPSINGGPGCSWQGVAQFMTIQNIREEYIEPMKAQCNTSTPQMQRPYKISNFALKIIMYHFLYHFSLFDILLSNNNTDDKSAYELVVGFVNDLIKACIVK